jgi:hypothetical protein
MNFYAPSCVFWAGNWNPGHKPGSGMIAKVKLAKSRAGVFCSFLVNQTEIFITVFGAALTNKIYYAINLSDQ